MASSVVRIRVPTFDVVYEVFTMGGRPAVTLSQIAVLIYWLILGVAYRGLHGAVRGTGHVRIKRGLHVDHV